MSNLLHCYNRGCGQTYDPEKNTDDSCCHHPGAPYFHDAYKGWSCCEKKSVDFTEFLNIKGCTYSKHSNVKPPEPEKPPKESTETVVVEREPIKEAMPRPPLTSSMVEVKASLLPSLKQAIEANAKKGTPVAPAAADLSATGEVPVGTACVNKGCTYSYSGSADDYGQCEYHPGVPIFHEGMKYWSCCQKKTSDFSVFMAQKGCVLGQHKWFKDTDNKKVECRYDWHQTATNVIVTIYAKLFDAQKSLIEVNPIRLHVNLVFPEQDNAVFNLDLELRGVIDVQKTSAQMGATKVEITMPKAEPGSWAKLDFPNAKLPPIEKQQKGDSKKNGEEADPDDDFDLDDIETNNSGFRLSEIATTKPDLD